MSLAPDISGFTISEKGKKLVSLEWMTKDLKKYTKSCGLFGRPIVDIYILHLLSHEDLL